MINNDERYMQLAIELAKKAEGKTSPNPIVGAVIVKNGKVVGRGYHKKAGLPHAEINALRSAGRNAKNAVLYVNLEPCDHFGRTPPCTDAIIKSGIKKVVIGMQDPNPINSGSGIKKLRKHNIKVISRTLKEKCESINKPYIKFITTGMPYVAVKVAQSLDGKIATKKGDSKWISSEDSRGYVHELRGRADAIMVGAGTVIRDDPLLLCNLSRAKQPVRVIVAGNSKISPKAKIFSTLDKSPVIIAKQGSSAGRRADLVKLLKLLGRQNITNILVEGGGELIASLAEKDLIDKLFIFIAPKIIGGRDAKTSVEGSGIDYIKDAIDLNITSVKRFKRDILIEAER